MNLVSKTLPDGRTVYCLNPYEVDFSVHEIFGDDLAAHGIDLPRDGVFVDVGANIGLFAMYLHGLCPDATIHAYEPIPTTFAALERNIAGLSTRCHAHRTGLGAAPGNAAFDHFPGITGLSTARPDVGRHLAAGLKKLMFSADAGDNVQEILDRTGATEARQDESFVRELFRSETVECPISTLSGELADHGIDRVDLLKIDTEGSEKDVLAGIAEGDWSRIRQLMVEVHLGREETDAIERDLQRRGYRTTTGAHPLSRGGVPVFHVYASRR